MSARHTEDSREANDLAGSSDIDSRWLDAAFFPSPFLYLSQFPRAPDHLSEIATDRVLFYSGNYLDRSPMRSSEIFLRPINRFVKILESLETFDSVDRRLYLSLLDESISVFGLAPGDGLHRIVQKPPCLLPICTL